MIFLGNDFCRCLLLDGQFFPGAVSAVAVENEAGAVNSRLNG